MSLLDYFPYLYIDALPPRVYVGALRLRGGCQPPVYLVKGLSPPVNVRPTRMLTSTYSRVGATPNHRPAANWKAGVEHVAGGFARTTDTVYDAVSLRVGSTGAVFLNTLML